VPRRSRNLRAVYLCSNFPRCIAHACSHKLLRRSVNGTLDLPLRLNNHGGVSGLAADQGLQGQKLREKRFRASPALTAARLRPRGASRDLRLIVTQARGCDSTQITACPILTNRRILRARWTF